MTRSAPLQPYRVLLPDTVRALGSGWDVVVEGRVLQTVSEGEPLSGWDAKLEFGLRREFEIVRDPARELGLRGSASCCELVIAIATGNGLRQDVLYREPVPPGNGTRLRALVSLNSENLAKEIVVSAGVYLTDTLRPVDGLSPWAAGQKLWDSATRVRLEGGASRLPMYEVSFSEAFPGDGVDSAEFRVVVLDEPALDVEYSVMVYLNSLRPDFIADLVTPFSRAEQRLWSGVIRQALTATIFRESSGDPGGESPGSLGGAIRRWAGQIWPSLDLSGVRDLATAEYPRYEAQIESWVQSCFSSKTASPGV